MPDGETLNQFSNKLTNQPVSITCFLDSCKSNNTFEVRNTLQNERGASLQGIIYVSFVLALYCMYIDHQIQFW